MLLIVGEPIVAYQRDLSAGGRDASFHGPWPSGSPAICAYVAGRLGTATTFVGGIGSDNHGDLIRDGLAHGGVNVDHLVNRTALPTAWARVTYESGDRTFEFHVQDSAATDLRESDLDDLPERTEWLHMSGSALVFGGTLVDTTLAALHRAKRAGAQVSVDPNVRPESLAPGLRDRLVEAIRLADFVLPSTGELEALGLVKEDLVADGAIVCETHADKGVEVITERERTQVPAVLVSAVDTDGAGDSFAAGFISAMLRGRNPLRAAHVGVAAAAAAVTEHGPMTATFESLRVAT